MWDGLCLVVLVTLSFTRIRVDTKVFEKKVRRNLAVDERDYRRDNIAVKHERSILGEFNGPCIISMQTPGMLVSHAATVSCQFLVRMEKKSR